MTFWRHKPSFSVNCTRSPFVPSVFATIIIYNSPANPLNKISRRPLPGAKRRKTIINMTRRNVCRFAGKASLRRDGRCRKAASSARLLSKLRRRLWHCGDWLSLRGQLQSPRLGACLSGGSSFVGKGIAFQRPFETKAVQPRIPASRNSILGLFCCCSSIQSLLVPRSSWRIWPP